MGLFKNEVGRPSNETLEKRRTVYIVIVLVLVALVGAGVFFTVKYFSNKDGDVSGKGKNAAIGGCVMPYNRNNCASAGNATVKEIQRMLKKKGFYSSTIDGNFGPGTQTAVKNFQKSQGVSQDGNVGPDTLKRLANATGTGYYEITYSANGGSGSLNYNGGYYTGAWNNKQIILKGVSTALSNGKFTKSGQTHVGYKATSSGKFYNIGQYVSSFPYNSMTLSAVYCPTGQTYNSSTGKCTGGNNSSSQTYNPQMTCYKNGTAIKSSTTIYMETDSISCKVTGAAPGSKYAWYFGSSYVTNAANMPAQKVLAKASFDIYVQITNSDSKNNKKLTTTIKPKETVAPKITISAAGNAKINVTASDNFGLAKLVLDCNTPNRAQTTKTISGKTYSGTISDYRMGTGSHYVCAYDTFGNMTKSNSVYVKGMTS